MTKLTGLMLVGSAVVSLFGNGFFDLIAVTVAAGTGIAVGMREKAQV